MSRWHRLSSQSGRPDAGGRRLALATVILAGLLVMVMPARSAASSVQAPAVYHVAVLASYTGPFSDVGQAMWEGAKDGAAAVNASGGILGHKLVVDLVDTIGDPADAVTALNKEMAFNHPIGCIGPTTSEIFGVHNILDRDHLPF